MTRDVTGEADGMNEEVDSSATTSLMAKSHCICLTALFCARLCDKEIFGTKEPAAVIYKTMRRDRKVRCSNGDCFCTLTYTFPLCRLYTVTVCI